ncbi:MAG: M23 family metallopeptidase [Acidimicrobiales bacterium]
MKIVVATVAAVVAVWMPAAVSAATTTTTAPTTTGPATTGPTTTGAGSTTTTSTTTTIPAEIPADEAKLQGLLADVHGRLDALAGRIGELDAAISSNQGRLDAANRDLARAQALAGVADGRLAVIRLAQMGALIEIRNVAVSAYEYQPVSELADLLLHASTPGDLLDAKGVYRTIVDVQEGAIKTYDKLRRAADAGVHTADQARDAAARTSRAVTAVQGELQTLRQTLVGIQHTSDDQVAAQTALLGELGTNKPEFEAELAAQAAESLSITALLQSLSVPTGDVPAAGDGTLALPVPGAPITQRFGPNSDPFTGVAGFHPGVDFGASTGTPIQAPADGTVVYAGEESGYGNYTCIDHGKNVATCYGHQSAILVKLGDHVRRGQVIGLVGSTGYSTGPHLHFEVRVGGTPVDPLPWLHA